MDIQERERWGTRIGLILAAAGNAMGLGNFLRFPVQAAQNGGGAFMIPYFIALLLLGIPLMWIEWTIGRHGGKYGHSSAPGMFQVLWGHPVAKYLGALGLFISLTVMMYYTYVESWTLAYSVFSALGYYFDISDFAGMRRFLESYQGLAPEGHFQGIATAYLFLLLTFSLNLYVLYRGISRGIEALAKIAMPMLFLFAIVLVVRVFTLGTPDPTQPEKSVWSGFAFLWNPDLSALSNAKVWLAAAGQIFFTLSVGMGTLHAYASYLRENDDIALSALATATTNEFVEVILGASIAIPIAVAFFGVQETQEIAQGGAFNLGFVSMPIIFTKIPLGQLLGTLWFALLFFAGITSSVAMGQPVVAFLQDEFKLSRAQAVGLLGIFTFIGINCVVLFLGHGFLDELDFWAGTFGLAAFALIETILLCWVFGIDKAWEELNRGADIRIPAFFKFVMKYITPLYLIVIFTAWTIQDAIPTLGLEGVKPEDVPYRWGARLLMLFTFTAVAVMVALAWRRRRRNGLETFERR